MRNNIGFILLIGGFFLFTSPRSWSQTPREVLEKIPFIDSIKQISNDSLFNVTYEIWFRMPLDHGDSNSGTFPLKAYYSHKDFQRPMVVVLDGYAMYTSRANELSRILDANQLTIEHRFFDHSRPADSIPWKYLDIRQAAADEHSVIEVFKTFYRGKWISTGISKSGQTTIYHRRFYPEDVDISVPYVAPLNFSDQDPRVYAFLKTVGSEACRNRIYQYQIELFKRKPEILPMFEKLAGEKNWEFSMGLERAYDLSILEYSFAFWQWGMSCDSIPGNEASSEVLFKHICKLEPFTFFEEKEIEKVRPFFYQSMTETGMYGYETKPFNKYLNDTTNVTFGFTMPHGYKAVFHPEVMQDIDKWVKSSGNYMLYLYGQNDAWSSTAVDPGDRTNAVKMVNPGGGHRTRIKSFPVEMQDSIYKVLEKWLGMDIPHPVQENNLR